MKKTKTDRPLRRMSPDDFFVAQQVLSIAALIGIPEEQTQRKAFIKLIPTIYVIRERLGFTFKQITALSKRCGFSLTQSTIRVYYFEFQPRLQKECDARMQECNAMMQELPPEVVAKYGTEIDLSSIVNDQL